MPTFRRDFSFQQADGTEIKLKGWGTDLYATFETNEGFTVLFNKPTGNYEYAKKDGGALVLSGTLANESPPEGLEKHLRDSKEEIKRKIALSPLYHKPAPEVTALAGDAIPRPTPPGTVTRGHVVGLCLLIKFPKESSADLIQPSEVSDFCNKVGYNNFDNSGSVYDYFSEVSLGNFTYEVKVAPWYTAKFKRSYYTDPNRPLPEAAQELVSEALKHHRNNGFDFSELTLAAGRIKALSVYYSGTCTNRFSEGLWPHSFHLKKPVKVGNNIAAYKYQVTDMTNKLALGTFIHENAHMVCDFPDLYDYDYTSSGIGAFCLMSAGNYYTQTNPIKVCGYLRYRAGWVNPIPINPGAPESFILAVDQAMIFKKPGNGEEYFLLEYRKKERWDLHLPAEGLAIWHVDHAGNNQFEIGSPSKHYECALIQADGLKQLEGANWPGDAGDLFPFQQKNIINDQTTPNLKWWDGSNSNLEISNITLNPGFVRFTLALKAN